MKTGALVMAIVDLILLAVLGVFFVWLLFPETGDVEEAGHQVETEKQVQSEQVSGKPSRTGSYDLSQPPGQVISGLSEPDADTFQRRYFKLGSKGERLPDASPEWVCVLDREQALVWEVKLNDGSWRDTEFTYSWYRETPDAEPSGKADSGDCLFINCDTQSYVAEMNRQQICGVDNWRLPSQRELQLLDHPVHFSPDIDRDYFPYTRSGQYWSGSENKFSRDLAWSVDFANGISYVREKRLSCHLRLAADFRGELPEN